MYAFLNAGLEIRFRDERPGHTHSETFQYKGGIVDFVRHLNASKEPLFKKVAYFEVAEADSEVEVALQWNTGYYEGLHCSPTASPPPKAGCTWRGSRRP